MKIFQCQACDQPVTFEATACESCERRLGYACARHEVSALEPAGFSAHPLMGGAQIFHAYADPGPRYRYCQNAVSEVCNWLVPEESPDIFCTACRHNRVVPDAAVPWNLARWRPIEAAKHRLFYSLLRLELPLATRAQYTDGLAFDFLVDPSEAGAPGAAPVLTGHINGLITMNIAEADDVERERRRILFGEHYRTLLGHFRHEIGHYFWYLLVMNGPYMAPFRALFGDESLNYVQALQDHYARGAPADWDESYVSAYATAHPWEDFAETFAHYLHIVDTIETASTFELHVRPRLRHGPRAPTVIDFDPYDTPDLDRLIEAWLPLTYAVNSLSRSMGQPALYPFKLTPAVIAKLAFVHERIYAARSGVLPDPGEAGADILRAVITGLRRKVAAPTV
ncbi:putative zinc-binding peptidase [Methylobacterium sp. NEAU 140]|uniref:zinc-binding metallopeptidase family protein n=1 Tax=Methylobacterium sp. NEAU 140 TaxID=3064945 RepID=UPI002736D049|nr:putative zinc-binding peptidase [Methylobacterium sp. NEAU 140]MDP4022913.1 putative zinc-binding peptidase [Methylobacterium sp. NEAU 140]